MQEDQPDTPFDLQNFLPYLLNQAAEATSKAFQTTYRSAYGLTRTQWRVLANLGKFGSMTARDICVVSHEEKTKVSRAVAALEDSGLINRTPSASDRRAEILSLTDGGRTVLNDLESRAVDYNKALRHHLGDDVAQQLDRILRQLIEPDVKDHADDD